MTETHRRLLPGDLRRYMYWRTQQLTLIEQHQAATISALVALVPEGLQKYFADGASGRQMLLGMIETDGIGWDKLTTDDLRSEYGIRSHAELFRHLAVLKKNWAGLVEVNYARCDIGRSRLNLKFLP